MEMEKNNYAGTTEKINYTEERPEEVVISSNETTGKQIVMKYNPALGIYELPEGYLLRSTKVEIVSGCDMANIKTTEPKMIIYLREQAKDKELDIHEGRCSIVTKGVINHKDYPIGKGFNVPVKNLRFNPGDGTFKVEKEIFIDVNLGV